MRLQKNISRKGAKKTQRRKGPCNQKSHTRVYKDMGTEGAFNSRNVIKHEESHVDSNN